MSLRNGPAHILFVCVDNSIRSQIAEGLARPIFGERAEVLSAGREAKGVNATAIQVMREVGIDILQHKSKRIEDLPPAVVAKLDVIVTVCAEEVCPPTWSPRARKFKWTLPDPAGHGVSQEAKLAAFRATREVLKEQIHRLAAELDSDEP